jgi:hypothetical protein
MEHKIIVLCKGSILGTFYQADFVNASQLNLQTELLYEKKDNLRRIIQHAAAT